MSFAASCTAARHSASTGRPLNGAVCKATRNRPGDLSTASRNDPATGVMRHADAGYEDAIACAREKGLKLLNI